MTDNGNLSPRQFYHSTHSELSPGDIVKPGHRRDDDRMHFSDDWKEFGHNQFTWMTTEKPGRYKGGGIDRAYGRNTYEVEPLGLHNQYTYPGVGKPADNGRTWVSLAGAKVIRKVPDDEPRIGDTK